MSLDLTATHLLYRSTPRGIPSRPWAETKTKPRHQGELLYGQYLGYEYFLNEFMQDRSRFTLTAIPGFALLAAEDRTRPLCAA